MSRISSLQRVIWLTTIVAVFGCGSSDARKTLSGNVSINGKPVPAGEILFKPDADKGNAGPGGVAKIQAGKYETLAGSGVIGGPYQITVIPAPVAPPDESNPASGGDSGEVLPTLSFTAELPVGGQFDIEKTQ